MTRNEIISALKSYFRIDELVCPHAFHLIGAEQAWRYLNTEALHTLLVLRRDILNVPFELNNYVKKGKFSQRGYRCNMCDLVKSKTDRGIAYLSAHCSGAAFDVVSSKMTAEEMRLKIKDKADLLPYPIRIEQDVNWLHVDTFNDGSKVKIIYFKG